MTLSYEQRCRRLRERLTELAYWQDYETVELDRWTFDSEPWTIGQPWPNLEDVASIQHPVVEMPAAWPLENTQLDIDLGGEGLVRLRYADGTEAAYGLDPNHRRFPLKHRQFSVSAKCVARLPFGVPNRDARLGRARIVWSEPILGALVRHFELIAEAVDVLGDHEVVEGLLRAAEQAYYRLDWPSATTSYISRMRDSQRMRRIWRAPADLDAHPLGLRENQRSTAADALAQLRGALTSLQERYPQHGTLALTGHAHIDVAWLWPLAETRRKSLRTFHTAVELMDDFPDFRFNQSSAQLYHFVEQDDPALFDRIKAKVAAGQWEPVGGMWVEPDTNMPTGESLARQLLYGQRYFRRIFGKAHDVAWLPDCFGFSPALPQILRLAGIESFFTIKMNWSETNLFPYDLFWWEGLDGSRVLTHTFRNPIGGYNARLGPTATLETWKAYRGKHDHPESLLSFGYGNGGGGPTRDMLELYRDLANFPTLPALHQTKVSAFFERAHDSAERTNLPVWVGEIYLELHRATTTTQGRTKFLHRRAERDLLAAEAVSAMAALLGAGPLPSSLESHWRVILRNQFHDILPGTSIREVYEQTEAELADVIGAAGRVLDEALESIAAEVNKPGDTTALMVVNPELSARPLRVQMDKDIPGAQRVEDGWLLTGDTTVAPMSVSVVSTSEPVDGLSVTDSKLENAHVLVELGRQGRIARILDKRRGREVLAGAGNQIWAYVDKPREWDAWDIEADHVEMGQEITEITSIRVVESGPHRAAVRVKRRFRDSVVSQDIRLWANSARLDFHTRIEWHERRVLLKARFPLTVRADHATFECAFGVLQRPTHRNTSWDQAKFEVAAHRFVDLSEHGYGVSLLNDGRYGHHAVGNELGITLLRSPVYPDFEADEGEHVFTYSLYPHDGDWLSGGVLGEADDLNRPLLVRPVRAAAEKTAPAIVVDGRPLALGCLKRGEDGDDLILRIYEPAGGRGRVRLSLPDGWQISEKVNILEEPAGPFHETVGPFEIIGLRLTAPRSGAH